MGAKTSKDEQFGATTKLPPLPAIPEQRPPEQGESLRTAVECEVAVCASWVRKRAMIFLRPAAHHLLRIVALAI